MKNRNIPENQTTRRILSFACTSAIAVAFAVLLPQTAFAGQITQPRVPAGVEVPPGSPEDARANAFLVGHAVGTQNYICLPSSSGFAWTLFTPEATLFSDNDRQVITHFFSPNPIEDGAIRATWQDSRDSSVVWAAATPASTSTDPNFVAQGAVAWVRLEVVGTQDGPTGGDTLSGSKFVQRLNTAGGVAPLTGCSLSTDVGKKAFMPYTADYFFYFAPGPDSNESN